MHSTPAFFVLIPLQEGEIGNPDKAEVLFAGQVELFGELITQFAESVVDDLEFIGNKEEKVPFFGVACSADRRHFRFSEEFGNRRMPDAVFDLDIGQAFGPVNFDELGQIIDLFAGEFGTTFGVKPLDDTAAGDDIGKDLES